MAQRLIWMPRAQRDRREILAFWVARNGTNTYSLKLQGMFKEAAATILRHPDTGKITDIADVRVRWVRDYQIYYQIFETEMAILRIWDHRRDPETFALW